MHPQDILKYGHLTVLRTIENFPREHVEVAGAVGYWSVKDVLAHLSSYELMLGELLGSLLEPGPTPLLDEYRQGGQAFNDRQVDVLRHELPLGEILDEYAAAYDRAVGLARQIPPTSWRQDGILPWYGAEYDLEDFVVYTFYAHKREHCGQIQVFSDQFKKPAVARAAAQPRA